MAETGGSSTTIADPEENIDAVSAAGNAADNKETPKARRNRMRMIAERKRRSRLRNYFGELQALVPHVADKSDKGTVVGQAIDYIQSLEKTKATLEKRKLARQVAAEVAASSSSAPPQTAQGMAPAAMFLDVPDGCHDDVPPSPLQALAAAVPVSADVPQPQLLQQPLAAAVPAPPQLPMAAAGQVGFQTFSWPNLVLSVSNDNAYINVSVPRHLGMQNMVMVLSVLNNHGIDVVTAQVDSDAARSVLNIYARVSSLYLMEHHILLVSWLL
ncbi:transcription factor bHLH95-like [Miscanthus floridulus]|uniref:transcription factor bHLH95-like n=1 Tax=Miscanthus floridulus TaxID=154761 RepID=UPI003457EC42